MKLQVLREGQEKIDNYEHVTTSFNKIDVSHVIDNECEEILATDSLDDFTAEAVPQLVHALVSKLRLGGQVSIGGTDVRLFSKAVLNGVMTSTEASQTVSSINSASCAVSVRDALESAGLQVLDTHMNGIHFEIKARRV